MREKYWAKTGWVAAQREGGRSGERKHEQWGIVSEDITIRNMITRGTDAYLHLRPPRGC